MLDDIKSCLPSGDFKTSFTVLESESKQLSEALKEVEEEELAAERHSLEVLALAASQAEEMAAFKKDKESQYELTDKDRRLVVDLFLLQNYITSEIIAVAI
jgi:hypothetical protein